VLITFEGIDGAGKSTVIARVRQRWPGCLVSAEPTRAFRQVLYLRRWSTEAQLAMFMADRAAHVETFVRPALAAGHTVVLDRYYLSTAAYQMPDHPLNVVALHRWAPTPDVCVWLDVPVAVAMTRLAARGGDPEAGDPAAQTRRRTAYVELAASLPWVHRVDATQPLDDVVRDVLALVP
jgi:dTMP kinase